MIIFANSNTPILNELLECIRMVNRHTITEHGVTKQRCYSDSDPDFVCTIAWLATHYFSSLRCCMATALVWSWRLTTFEDDGTELWQRRCWHWWFEAIGMQDGNSKSRWLNIERGILEVGRGRQQLRSGPKSLER